MTKLPIDLEPFSTPNYVSVRMPPRPRQEGFVEGPKLRLKDLPTDVLAAMCDDFRAEIFKKAEKADPTPTPEKGQPDAK